MSFFAIGGVERCRVSLTVDVPAKSVVVLELK
jgi:hypothetical protein